MATVYLARDERHRRSVALKVLHPELAHCARAASASCARSRSRPTSATPTSCRCMTRAKPAGLLYYVMPYVEGESLRDRLRARDPAAGGGRAPDRARSGRCAGLRPRAGGDPPRHQAGEHPAQRWARPRRRFRDRPRAGPGRRRAADRDRDGRGDRRLHEPRTGQAPRARSTGGATSTAWAAWCTRCWPGSHPTPGRPPRRSSPSASTIRVPSGAPGAPERSRERGPGGQPRAGPGTRRPLRYCRRVRPGAAADGCHTARDGCRG